MAHRRAEEHTSAWQPQCQRWHEQTQRSLRPTCHWCAPASRQQSPPAASASHRQHPSSSLCRPSQLAGTARSAQGVHGASSASVSGQSASWQGKQVRDVDKSERSKGNCPNKCLHAAKLPNALLFMVYCSVLVSGTAQYLTGWTGWCRVMAQATRRCTTSQPQ